MNTGNAIRRYVDGDKAALHGVTSEQVVDLFIARGILQAPKPPRPERERKPGEIWEGHGILSGPIR